MARPRSIAFHTLGCKLNYSETSSIKRVFEEEGYMIAAFDQPADIYVINTCSVTDFADRKCRAAVRKVKKLVPESKVVMIGCYAQLKPQEISEIPGVDMVLGANEKFNLIHHIDELNNISGVCSIKSCDVSTVNDFKDAYSVADRTRSFLKVQDGCNYKCSFCTIPLARGKSRSDSLENVISNAEKLAGLNVQEIVLTGVNIGDYLDNSTNKNYNFYNLIVALDNLEGIERIRISSIEPNLCSNEIIEFVSQSKKFAPHFHMPLQSGSNKILSKMRRRYKRELYAGRVEKIKALMPHCCIGVDIIVGFPGETEEDFLETYQFINTLDVSYLHVFTYSERDNTLAPEMDQQVDMHVRRERNKMLRILSDKKKRKFYEENRERESQVIIESERSQKYLTGFTDNYIKVKLPIDFGKENDMVRVKLNQLCEEGLMTVSRP